MNLFTPSHSEHLIQLKIDREIKDAEFRLVGLALTIARELKLKYIGINHNDESLIALIEFSKNGFENETVLRKIEEMLNPVSSVDEYNFYNGDKNTYGF